MRRVSLSIIAVLFWLALGSCAWFNDPPVLTVSYGGADVAQDQAIALVDTVVLDLSIAAIDDNAIVTASCAYTGADVDLVPLDQDSTDQGFSLAFRIGVGYGNTVPVTVTVADKHGALATLTFSVTGPTAPYVPPETGTDYSLQMLIPGLGLSGAQGMVAGSGVGTPYYFNDLHIAAESDIIMTDPNFESLDARYYIHVAGTAAADDSGFAVTYPARRYHNVLFSVSRYVTATATWEDAAYYSIPVDPSGAFEGYIYFPQTGLWSVFAYRAFDDTLYPRGTVHAVTEGYSTLAFDVNVLAAVPSASVPLLPSEMVDTGTVWLRDFAATTFGGYAAGLPQLCAVYEYLADYAQFAYKYYEDIRAYNTTYQTGELYLTYNDTFSASDFLRIREGVCNDFAELFAAITRVLGYDVIRVYGTDAGGNGHMWNRIYAEGRWRNVDSTWANNQAEYDRNLSRIGYYADLGYPLYNDADFVAKHGTTFYRYAGTTY